MATVLIRFKLDSSGNPEWHVNPPTLHIPHDPRARVTIDWRLEMSPNTSFASGNGIAFDKGPPAWVGTTPSGGATHYSSEETNDNPGPNANVYSYSIRVVHKEKTYELDPDVSNDPPPPGGGGEEGDDGNVHRGPRPKNPAGGDHGERR